MNTHRCLRLAFMIVCITCLLAVLCGMPAFCQAQKPQLVVQVGHNREVRSVAFSPDGKTIASGGDDGTIKIWDIATGKLLRTLTGHISSVVFSPDGKTLASGSWDGTVKLWNPVTGKLMRTLTEHTSTVWEVAFSPNGKMLVSGSDDKTIRFWDPVTGKLLRTLMGHTGPVNSVAFSPDGKVLASGSGDKTIKIWDAVTGKLLRTLAGGTSRVDSVRFSPNGKTITCGNGNHSGVLDGTNDNTIRLWDVATGKLTHTVTEPTGFVYSVCFSPDGKTLLSSNASIYFWDIATGKLLRTITGHPVPVNMMVFSPDGKVLAGASGYSEDSRVNLWNLATGKLAHTFMGQTHDISSASVSPDGKAFVSVSRNRIFSSFDRATQDQTIKLRDMATGNPIPAFAGPTGDFQNVSFSPDGKSLAIVCFPDGSVDSTVDTNIEILNAKTGRLNYTLKGLLTGQNETVSVCCFSPDSKTIAVGGTYGMGGKGDSSIELRDLASGNLTHKLTGHRGSIHSMVYSHDGKTIASGSDDGTIKIWDPATGNLLHNLIWHTYPVEPKYFGGIVGAPVSFSPDDKTLASSGDSMIKLWDVTTGHLIRTLVGRAKGIYALSFSPDGKMIASGGSVDPIKLWDAGSGNLLHTFRSDGNLIRFSPDSKMLYALSHGITFLKASGQEACTFYECDNDGWAVVNPDGRFDGNEAGLQSLHYAVGLEPIDLVQLKNRYYEPGLLGKMMGLNREPLRNVTAFDHVNLYPSIQTSPTVPANGKLALQLTNQGGGIGRVQVFVNGKELSADARGPKPNPEAKTAEVTVDVSHAPGLVPGQPNTVKVVTWNAEGYLSSRGVECVYTPPGTADAARPELWAIVGGISDYAGPGLHLTYPAKDAADFAHALTLAAGNLFGADKVHLTLLDSDHATGAVTPTKAGLQQAFAEARKAKPGDIFVVYLAGHGVALPGSGTNDQNDLYCYLTADATTGDPAALSHDLTLRQATTVSSEELTDWVKQVPARKQVMVLDTCAAGAAAALLTAKRDVPSDQIRAIERLKDRTGFYVLMGCAADAASYETSRYRQGLLTYSLLKGMKGASLRDGQYVDVGSLFNYAVDEVPQLAQNIGGVQRPFVAAPSAGSFDVGELSVADRQAIPLAVPRPMVLRPELVPLADDLNLEALLVARLREENAADIRSGASGPGLAFVDATDFPGALQVRGAYTTDGDQVSVTLKLRRDGMDLKTLHLTGTRADLPGLVGKLSTAITGATETP